MEKQRLLKGHSWGVIVPTGDDRDPYKLDVIDNPSAEDRIAFVRTMTVEDRNCRKRLLEIAEIDNVGGDKNLLAEQSKAYYGFLANHVRCLLRFFAKENSFGFKPDMTDAIFSLCIQQWENCFLIAACGLVDLQMQRDLNMTDAQKYQCLDKSQVARRIMSAEDLMKFVYCDKGNSSIEMVLKLLGGRPGSEEEYLHVFRHKNDFVDEMIDFVFNRHLGRSGAGLVSFDVTVNFAPNQNRPDINKIPCFDGGRGSAPVGFLELDEMVPNETLKIREQLQAARTSTCTPVDNNGMVATQIDDHEVPSRQGSDVSSESISIPFGDEEATAPSKVFNLILGSLNTLFSALGFGGGSKEENAWPEMDRVASTPTSCGETIETIERHSVVCLGGISDKQGKLFFLMLNSWESMPLFLASRSYLEACRADALFIKKPMDEIPKEYDFINIRYSECSSPSTVKEFGRLPVRRRQDDGFWVT